MSTPKGRSSTDFPELSSAEKELVTAVREGRTARLNTKTPDSACDANRVRAGFIRYIALGGDGHTAIHEHGVRLEGAWIDDDVDLENCDLSVELALRFCRIGGNVILRDAQLFSLDLSGSITGEVSANRLRCTGTVFLRDNFRATKTVTLTGARIDGDVDCSSGTFDGGEAGALLLDGADIKGSVYLGGAFSGKGSVQLTTANIAGNLDCRGGRFEGWVSKGEDGREKCGLTLFCDQAKIGGSVFLGRTGGLADLSFRAIGLVRLHTVRVNGNLVCSGGSFEGTTDEGAFLLDGAEIKGSAFLDAGFTAKGTVQLSTANIAGNLICSGGRFEASGGRAIFGPQLKVAGSVMMNAPFSAKGAIILSGAEIGGGFECVGGTIESRSEDALQLSGADVKGSVSLSGGFHAIGPVNLSAAKIGRALNCTRGTFDNPNGDALFFEQAKIGASVFLSDQFHAKGVVKLTGADITGYLVCIGKFEGGPTGQAIAAEQVKVAGHAMMHKPFSARGTLRFIGARISGNFECTGTIEGTKEGALLLTGSHVNGSVALFSGFSAKGAVGLSVANIGGDLLCRSARVDAWNTASDSLIEHTALMCDQLQIRGSLYLDGQFAATGSVRLPEVRVGGLVNCRGGRFEGAKGLALFCDGAQIGGDVYLNDASCSGGVTSFIGARVNGNLYCIKSRFAGAHPAAEGRSLWLEGATIGRNLFIRLGFWASGEVRLYGVKVGGNLECQGGSFDAGLGKTAIDFEQARVAGHLIFRDVAHISGEVRLTGAHITTLEDDFEQSWSKASAIVLDGFQYERIDRRDSHPDGQGQRGAGPWLRRLLGVTKSSFILWLEKQPQPDLNQQFKPQPWEQLIRVLRATGDNRQAKLVAIHKQIRLRRIGKITGIGRFFHSAYGWLYSYGYRPGILASWVVGVWLALALLFWHAGESGVMAPTDRSILAECKDKPQPLIRCDTLAQKGLAFSPVLYSLERILPAASAEQSKEWAPLLKPLDGSDRFLPLGIFVDMMARLERLFGLIAAAMLGGVASGLVKKD